MPTRAAQRRPDQQTTDAILDLLKKGNTRKVAANACEVSDAQFKFWMQTIPAFRTKVEKAEADAEAAMVEILVQSALYKGAWQPALNWLSRRKPLDWGEIQRFEVYQKIEEIKDLQEELARENIHVPLQRLINDYQQLAASKAKGKAGKALKALPPPGNELAESS